MLYLSGSEIDFYSIVQLFEDFQINFYCFVPLFYDFLLTIIYSYIYITHGRILNQTMLK